MYFYFVCGKWDSWKHNLSRRCHFTSYKMVNAVQWWGCTVLLLFVSLPIVLSHTGSQSCHCHQNYWCLRFVEQEHIPGLASRSTKVLSLKGVGRSKREDDLDIHLGASSRHYLLQQSLWWSMTKGSYLHEACFLAKGHPKWLIQYNTGQKSLCDLSSSAWCLSEITRYTLISF